MRAIFPRMVIYHLVLFIWSSSAGSIDSVAMLIHIMTISHLIRRSHAFVSCVSQRFLQFEIYTFLMKTIESDENHTMRFPVTLERETVDWI